MNQNNGHDRDEARLAELLRAVEADVPPLDTERLAKLRELSAEAFAKETTSFPENPYHDRQGVVATSVARPLPDGRGTVGDVGPASETRNTPMMTLAMRGLVAAVAAAAIVLFGVFVPQPQPVIAGPVSFAEVLAELREAETLQFHLRRNVGKSLDTEIWVRAPGLVRKEESPQRYEIAAGSRLWRVDEEANTVNETDSPWFLSADKQIDLVGLLDVQVSDSAALLRARPVTKQPTAHGEEFVYLATLPSKTGDVTIEAFADVATKRLTRMTVWEGEIDFKKWTWLNEHADHIDRIPPLADMTLVAMNVPVEDDKFVVAKSLTEDGRIGKVSESQGLVVLRPMLAKRWTSVCRELLLKPGDWLRTELRGANAVKVSLSSNVELTLGPGSLIECISPTQARLHSGQVQVSCSVVQSSPVAPRQDSRTSGDAESKKDTEGKADANSAPGSPVAERQGYDQRQGYVLLAPRDGQRVFKPGDKQLVRVDRDETLVDVEKTPQWLAGFEGTSSNESLGSLIVQLPDGRNEPLTVGYHKVSVEIRDQIARTTIEESFVNHTASRLEGVFHFPLPQEASISGFGMWIGNELVEADVVEKQRAREIFETILREKRDPGLLEWTGGNIFKARVFPIEAHSEKRVKIVYTQVLPLRANRYRYSYGLRSELLRTKPLRELSLDVTIHSALPLRDVKCSTHPARVVGWDQLAQRAPAHQTAGDKTNNKTGGGPALEASLSHPTGHSAKVEFAAQEYTPTRDFEVVCEIDGRQSDVVVVPHRRGDDGYFLIQISPPTGTDLLGERGGVSPPVQDRDRNHRGADAAPLAKDRSRPTSLKLERDIVADGQPLSVVLLCDTSASMDSEKRKQQSEFVATVLASLGETDRFQLAVADVGTSWAFVEPVAATADNVAKVRAFLDDRVSLGWTNLDRAFDDVLKKAAATAHVIYIGDGIVSSGDTDPAAFVKRLGELEARNAEREVRNSETPHSALRTSHSLHAIGVGNANESIVLKGIAAVGGGSVRMISGEQTPQVVATELLNEIASPGLRDINVEFRGLRVAAVYPERLPNVAAGTQQILVGRYLPEGQDQVGEIIVTGRRGNEQVRYAARVNLKEAESGNSFIPRLWARGHLDQLLAQGPSAAIRDEIIRLSEEFHIITPFTSLLVLESDADRERFGVKRRYEMRDGERFFAEGRDHANYDLLRQQMQRAGDWRLGLRRQVLRELAGLGRNPHAFQQQLQRYDQLERRRAGVTSYSSSGLYFSDGLSELQLGEAVSLGRSRGSGVSGYWDSDSDFKSKMLGDRMDNEFESYRGLVNNVEDLALKSFVGEPVEEVEKLSFGVELRLSKRSSRDEVEPLFALDDVTSFDMPFDSQELPMLVAAKSVNGPVSYRRAIRRREMAAEPGLTLFGGLKLSGGLAGFGGRASYRSQPETPNYAAWVNTLFPALPPAPKQVRTPPELPKTWSPEAIALSKSLLRTDSLRELEGGIELRRTSEQTDPRWKRTSSSRRELALYSPTAWLTRPLSLTEQTIVQFCDAKERGVFSAAFLLGRTRGSVASEQQSPPLPVEDFSLTALHETYPGYSARVESARDGRAKLIFETVNPKNAQDRKLVGELLIDTAKHVVVKVQWFDNGKLSATTSYEDFVEVAGTWWAKSLKSTDAKGRLVSQATFEIESLAAAAYSERLATELAAKPRVQFLRQPFVRLPVARQRVADGSASFDDRLTMILHNASIQQWDELWRHVDAIEQDLQSTKPGVRWLRTLLLSTIRRNEEARQRLLAEAKQLAAGSGDPRRAQADPHESFLAHFILGQAHSIMGWPEYFEFVQLFEAANTLTRSASEGERSVKPGTEAATDAGEPKERAPSLARRVTMRFDREHLQEARLQCLDALGRYEEALALRKTMVEQSPWHLHWQTDYAVRLGRAGQVEAAIAWLRKELARDIEWAKHEEETLRTAICEVFRSQARWDDLLKFTTEWTARKPESHGWNSAYSQHLSALIFNNQLDAANGLVEQWFREARIDGELTPDQRARLETAIQFANGQCYQLSFQRADERWFEQVAATIRFFLRHKHHSDIATRGIGNHWFQQSDEADRLRGEFLGVLIANTSPTRQRVNETGDLTPAQINALLGWTLSGRMELREPLNGRQQLNASEVPNDVWQAIAAALKTRWLATKDADDKHLLGESLRSIYATRFADSELLPFLRERLAAVQSADIRLGYVGSLFETLLTTTWSDAIEQEAFTLLPQLSDAEQPADRLAVQVPTLHRLVDAMLANRVALAERTLADLGEQNKLTRKELAAKKGEFRKIAREQLTMRLLEEEAKLRLAKRVPSADDLANWLQIERTWLDLSLDQNLPQVEEFCWQILGEVPNVGHVSNVPGEDDDEGEHVENVLHEVLDAMLKQRAFTTVMNLAARRKAEPATIARVLKFIDAGIRGPVAQSRPVAPRQESRTSNDADAKQNAAGAADANSDLGSPVAERQGYEKAAWRTTKFRLLIALDRADDLERELRQWIRDDVSTAPWRQALARLLAERGKLDEAISLFEACEKDRLLSADDYRSLADWYLVRDRREAHQRARLESFKQMPEHQLSNVLAHATNRWTQQNGHLPSELDEETLLVVQALFEKSASPENYLWQHSNLYAACRDFRLLKMLPHAVLGRSPQQVYAFLQTLQSAALGELRNEAAADEILETIQSIRASGAASAPRLPSGDSTNRGADAAPLARTLTPTDLRALDLLEAIVERKSSELLNQPGPHVEKCVAALKRAFDREWGVGEPLMMARFLHQLGGLTNEALRAEQLRELRELQRRAAANSRDHLLITLNLTELLFWNYSQQAAGLQAAEAEVTAYSQANGGVWPHLDNDALSRFVSMREGANQHAAGETLLKSFLAKSLGNFVNERRGDNEQSKWLRDRLMTLYNHALEHDGAVSLGTGRANVFRPLVALHLEELAAAPDENVRHSLVARIVTTFDIARRHELPGTVDVVKAFAFETLPNVLKQQQSQYRNTATTPMHVIAETLGPKLALRYAVERIEQYPQHLDLAWDHSWNAFGYELARRRAEAASQDRNLGDLEPRAFKLVVRELKRELRTGESRSSYIFHTSYQYFWSEKANDFAKAAEEVLAERRGSGRRAITVANYLWSGLDRPARAIEILLLTHKDGRLDESGQGQLVNWLHQQSRFAESIPLLEPLVARRPDFMSHRTQLMLAYHRSQRPQQLVELVEATHKHFHADGRWTESNVAAFAHGCQSCELHGRAVGHFDEAITRHQRSNPGSGLGDGTLSSYYQSLAESHITLGHTREAVEAASAAIVCWGPTQNQRRHAIDRLNSVLARATDLEKYVEHLDAEAVKSGQDSPILRKAIGQTYQSKQQFERAITQFQLALDLQSHDRDVHQALIACYDATQNSVAATKQLLKLIDLQRHDLALFVQLADRLKDNEAEAERAATSIIESAPNEAESHAAMAELRQKQNRWSEAIPHWQRVAELRRLEPTGLLKLTDAQLHEQQWDAARQSIQKLQRTEWPSRFGDITSQTRPLQERLPK